ncbi:MAG: VOC family protein [Drouetiella hepatica Uher 2000/2452]|jgi:catechol 2,3-dioxygenase-like lactoylglutathione lyase family enzyme|uniref:VOC family protein n=1 Tax=Drouetiella hepatica Uher 2000/2452 TaxID=904376 RepID=A0A951QAE9_9CYAN|nr:VOC family protein [Drouetiella hepatica Uher 2000/2452]
MKFAYTILYVSDVVRSVAFYEKAFGVTQRFIDETKQYAEIETGATALAFASNDLAKSNFPEGFQENSLAASPAGIEIGFVTEDVPAAFLRAVEAGAIALAQPKVKPWGQTVAYVRDLDGILVELCSPI